MKQNNLMTRLMINVLAIPLTLCAAAQSYASNIGVDIHVGFPAPPVVMVPRPVYRQPAPTFYFNESPEFVYMQSAGFYMAVGSPYDLFYDNNDYYISYEGYWHRSSTLDGPWRIVDRHALPSGFHRHDVSQFRRYRDREYNAHRHQRRDYSDRRYSPRHDRDYREHREGRRHRDSERYYR